jgi:hypothetical protein
MAKNLFKDAVVVASLPNPFCPSEISFSISYGFVQVQKGGIMYGDILYRYKFLSSKPFCL